MRKAHWTPSAMPGEDDYFYLYVNDNIAGSVYQQAGKWCAAYWAESGLVDCGFFDTADAAKERVEEAFARPTRRTLDEEWIVQVWTPRLAMATKYTLAVMPTALLAGAYGAILFLALAIGPAWVGFVAAAAPVSGLAAWAFSDGSGNSA